MSKWLGRCPQCGAWNSLAEDILPAGGGGGEMPVPARRGPALLVGRGRFGRPGDLLHVAPHGRAPGARLVQLAVEGLGVGRVIARPFVGTPGEFRRSQNWIGGTRPGNAAFAISG